MASLSGLVYQLKKTLIMCCQTVATLDVICLQTRICIQLARMPSKAVEGHLSIRLPPWRLPSKKGCARLPHKRQANNSSIRQTHDVSYLADQVVTPSTGRRLQGQLYSVLGAAMRNFDSTISPAFVNPSRLEEIMVIGSSHLFHQLRPLRQQHLQERR